MRTVALTVETAGDVSLTSKDLLPAASNSAWYCLHTLPRHEKRVAQFCAASAVPCFLPLRKSVRCYGGRGYEFHVPLFPGYLFCAADDGQRHELLRTGHLVKALAVPDQESLLGELRQIALALDRDAELGAFRFLRRGVPVRVVRGPFKGIEGIISERKGKHRVILNATFIRQSVAFEVAAWMVEPI